MPRWRLPTGSAYEAADSANTSARTYAWNPATPDRPDVRDLPHHRALRQERQAARAGRDQRQAAVHHAEPAPGGRSRRAPLQVGLGRPAGTGGHAAGHPEKAQRAHAEAAGFAGSKGSRRSKPARPAQGGPPAACPAARQRSESDKRSCSEERPVKGHDRPKADV